MRIYTHDFEPKQFLSEHMKAAGWLNLAGALTLLSLGPVPMMDERGQRSHSVILAEEASLPDDGLEEQ